MRTTITLEHDIEDQLKRYMRERGLSFKAAVNQALRQGLASMGGDRAEPSVKVQARALDMCAGIDPARLNAAVDDLDIEAFAGVSQRQNSDDQRK